MAIIRLLIRNERTSPAYSLLAEFLQRLNLADKYEGVIEPDGTVGHIAALDDGDASRPFKAFLDVVLKRTSTGSKYIKPRYEEF
ncbi:hypothetical protein C2G38_2244984 [Gigaspora rosea]|uniref:Uncharacterized protein n=1 Tax=Gigaspora rosea TaxID=44941 RepID=A0A397VB73_9GLOM|nr:hypothetical protein C2G38_2244984 [Gigaspora rosea]